MKFKDIAWVYISLLTLITALIWLGVSVRSTFLKTTVPQETETLTIPLDPVLDQNVLKDLQNRSGG